MFHKIVSRLPASVFTRIHTGTTTATPLNFFGEEED